ncbi:hypothetical protein E2C01_066003 [Portunus trituberculatus]|uniref:Uncharacterized protein n=1 Tax=Portunus trituberculatus TaxID=210409 RepID=A0A5B7HR65_PORTR|nr:hypothetical protein [Portunus trituberculatus]
MHHTPITAYRLVIITVRCTNYRTPPCALILDLVRRRKIIVSVSCSEKSLNYFASGELRRSYLRASLTQATNISPLGMTNERHNSARAQRRVAVRGRLTPTAAATMTPPPR